MSARTNPEASALLSLTALALAFANAVVWLAILH